MSEVAYMQRLGVRARRVAYSYDPQRAAWTVTWTSPAYPDGRTVASERWPEVWSIALAEDLREAMRQECDGFALPDDDPAVGDTVPPP